MEEELISVVIMGINIHLKIFLISLIVFAAILVIIKLWILFPEYAFKIAIFALTFGVIYYWVYVYQTEVG